MEVKPKWMKDSQVKCEEAKLTIDSQSLSAARNYPCPVCWNRRAVFDCNRNYFKPCWDCQAKGWHVANVLVRTPWWKRLLGRKVLNED